MVFNEDEFPFQNGFINTKRSEDVVCTNNLFPDLTSLQVSTYNSEVMNDNTATCGGVINGYLDLESVEPQAREPITSNSSNRIFQPVVASDQLEVCLDIPQETSAPQISTTTQHSMTTHSKSGITKAKTPYVGMAAAQTNANLSTNEPLSVEEALSIPHWKDAMVNKI